MMEASNGDVFQLEAYQIAERREAEELHRIQIPVTARFIALGMLTIASTAVVCARATGRNTITTVSAAAAIAQRGIQFAFPLYYYHLARADAADTSKINYWTRTAVPVATAFIGLPILVIPAIYLEVNSNPVSSYFAGNCGFTTADGYGQFFKLYFQNFGCGGFDWLWLQILDTMVFILNLPLTWWVRTRYISRYSNAGRSNYIDLKFVISQMLLFITFFAGATLWGGQIATTFLPQLLNYALIYILVVQYHNIKSQQYVLTILQLVALPISILTACFKMDGVHYINLSFYFLNLFYVQGVIDEVFSEEHPPKSAIATPLIMIFNSLLLSVGTPQETFSPFSIFSYPFSNSIFWNVLMFLGGWTLLFMSRRYLDSMFMECCDPRLYRSRSIIFAASTVYFFHGLIAEAVSYGANTSSMQSIHSEVNFIRFFFFSLIFCCLIYVFILVIIIRMTNSRGAASTGTSIADLSAIRKDSLHFEEEMAAYYK